MSKKISLYGILIAQAILMGYIERLIPLPIQIPGIKLGLANIVVVMALYMLGNKHGFLISIIKAVVVGSMFAGPASIIYSMSGTLLSLLCMLVLKKIKVFSIIGVSIIGSVTHNFGQIVIASIVIGSTKLFYYYPPLILSGIVTGYIIGYLCAMCLKNLNSYPQNKEIN